MNDNFQPVEAADSLSALDIELLSHLDRLVFSNRESHDQLTAAYKEAELVLNDIQNTLPYSCQEVNIADFKKHLPEHLREHVNLCRVFLLKQGYRLSVPEVHRNSVQRLVSFKNNGAIHIAKTDSADMTFRKFELASTGDDCSRELRHRWNIVPANTWHFPEASSLGDWCTVTFHSASSAEIIDEDWIEEL
jgi:hypothetical protein